jgi:NhaP-type Na+/H+ or K+/H+ antiporter
MRGTVTLAAALALPVGGEGGAPFPYRDLILVTAFGVVLGTLVLQGLTLRPLLLRLRLEDDGAVDREVRLARVEFEEEEDRRGLRVELEDADEQATRRLVEELSGFDEVAAVRWRS